ncbi:hypothetical protein N0V83_005515 [Neocucurbitaria cava]|uniref:Uncharacterized protein n=1 Tax=Neocucurbitaria cava TaxID=798079 RepID=A0A9W8Y813_9PLEO|nr:hypothetical protein N0V83_005515 [Neocucurbitaria cava]
MATNHILPPRKPNTAKETDNALRELGFTNHLRNVSKSAKDAVEVIPSSVPTDVNMGQSPNIKNTISAAIANIPQPAAFGKLGGRSGIKRSASSELLKIDDLSIYKDACAEYNRGLREGWSKERLLQTIDKWQELNRSERLGD